MNMHYSPHSQMMANYGRQLQAAYDAVQDAKNSGDEQALGYAEGQVLRLRREIAKLDPRGYGNRHLETLSQAERDEALRNDA